MSASICVWQPFAAEFQYRMISIITGFDFSQSAQAASVGMCAVFSKYTGINALLTQVSELLNPSHTGVTDDNSGLQFNLTTNAAAAEHPA
jgi:hypothetical protein